MCVVYSTVHEQMKEMENVLEHIVAVYGEEQLDKEFDILVNVLQCSMSGLCAGQG